MFLWKDKGATAETGVGIMSGSCVDADESVEDCVTGLRLPLAAAFRSASIDDAIVSNVDIEPREVRRVCDDG